MHVLAATGIKASAAIEVLLIAVGMEAAHNAVRTTAHIMAILGRSKGSKQRDTSQRGQGVMKEVHGSIRVCSMKVPVLEPGELTSVIKKRCSSYCGYAMNRTKECGDSPYGRA